MNKSNILYLAICMITAQVTQAEKLLIMTQSYNRPDFIELQDRTFKAFLQDEYEFVVMNDAKDQELHDAIHATCNRLNLKCYDINQKNRNPGASQRTGYAIQASMESIGFKHNGIVVIIDSDMFLVRPFSIKKYLENYDLVGLFQATPSNRSIHYLWNGLLFMDMRTLPNKTTMNFRDGYVDGHWGDTGLMLHYYLKQNPSVRLKHYREDQINVLPKTKHELKQLGYDTPTINYILAYKEFDDPYSMQFHVEGNFVHYRAGGNWTKSPQEYHRKKTEYLVNFIESMMQH